MKRKPKEKGIVIVYTGDGKGKTTAALGMALRAAGYRRRIGIVQFIKGSWFTGEMRSIERLKPEVELFRSGKGFVGIIDDRLPRADHRQAAQVTLKLARKLLRSRRYDLVICDEINYAVHLRLVRLQEVLDLMTVRPANTTLVMTGNHASPKVIAKADLVTEMRMIKHPFEKGVKALRGIDF